MHFRITLSAAAAVLGLASAANAQERTLPEKQPLPSRTELLPSCNNDDGRVECRIFRRADLDSVLAKRAALGIQLSATGSVRDTLGVFVSRVTPKGPAENAGIIEGDRIVSINGVDLRLNAADAGDSYASGLPSRRLTRELEKASPGSTVNLRVWSAGRVRDVRVTAGRASDLRDRGSFGYIFEGRPGAMVFGDMPSRWMQLRDLPRMELRDLPRMELRNLPRMELRSFPRMRIDEMPRIYYEKKSDESKKMD